MELYLSFHQVDPAWDRGDYRKAQDYAWRAQQWSLIGIVIGIFAYMTGVVLFVIIFAIDVSQGGDSRISGLLN